MKNRSLALDALRGIAIIGMVLSGTVAGTLPAWMYHAQVGPRSGMKFDPSFLGITWVDLVFPFFLFAMGAAIPLALGRRLDSGIQPVKLLPPIVKRAFLLAVFAITIYHCTPYRVSGNWNYELALLAFVLFFASFARFRFLTEKSNSVFVLTISGLMPYINRLHEITPWFGLLKGLIITGGMMVVTIVSTRKKWLWKT